MDRILKKADHAFETLSKLLLTMRMAALVFSIYALVQGMMIVFGRDGRFSAPGYAVASSFPGAPDIWGAWMIIAGSLAFYGIKTRSYRVAWLGMGLSGIWSILFGGAFLASAIQSPNANLTAIAVYGKDAVIFLLLASANRDLANHAKIDREQYDAQGKSDGGQL